MNSVYCMCVCVCVREFIERPFYNLLHLYILWLCKTLCYTLKIPDYVANVWCIVYVMVQNRKFVTVKLKRNEEKNTNLRRNYWIKCNVRLILTTNKKISADPMIFFCLYKNARWPDPNIMYVFTNAYTYLCTVHTAHIGSFTFQIGRCMSSTRTVNLSR